jgi:hypothetical protein
MKFISFSTTRQIGRAVLQMKKNSPHLFFAGGLVGNVASTYLACRATLKLPVTMEKIKHDIQTVKERKESPQLVAGLDREYTERDYIHDLTYVYGQSAKALVKLYGPAAILGVASTGALTGSHLQMTRRNSALTATAAALSKAYDDYRERVRAEVGEEKELELHRALTEQKVEIDGKKELVKITGDPDKWSPYMRFFDDASPNWQKDAELNQIFIKCQQNYANHLLQARGHVFLNEVYDALGLERSRAGAVVGWVLNGESSDNFIDFGVYEAYNEKFVNGHERSALLDFNVDGVIYDLI